MTTSHKTAGKHMEESSCFFHNMKQPGHESVENWLTQNLMLIHCLVKAVWSDTQLV